MARRLQLGGEFLRVVEAVSQYGELGVAISPPGLNLVRGLVPEMIAIRKFGRNPDIDANVREDIWVGGGTWVAPTVPRLHNFSSSSALDATGSGGALTMGVEGLDSNYDLVTETITLNGTANVAGTVTYANIHRMYIENTGGSIANVGTITATAVTDNTITAMIGPGDGQTLQAIYMVPRGYTGYITRMYGGVTNAQGVGVGVNVRITTQEQGKAQQVKNIIGLASGGTSGQTFDYQLPQSVPAKSVIKLSAITVSNNLDISGGFDLVMVANQ